MKYSNIDTNKLICEENLCFFFEERKQNICDKKMLLFRYYFLGTFAMLAFLWPISYLLSWCFYKKRVNRITKNMPAVDDYPILGIALRFLNKNNEGDLFLMEI